MSGRWLLSAGDTGKPSHRTDQTASGPLTEIDLGTRPALILQYRDLADLDELWGVIAEARADHGEEQVRHAARPLMPVPERDAEPAWAAPAIEISPGAVMEVLIDPDCIAGKHASCMGGPCTCSCHGDEPIVITRDELLADWRAAHPGDAEPDDLPRRAPLEAPIGSPVCGAHGPTPQDVCQASPHGDGDHATFSADGSVRSQWASEDATT